MDLADRLTGPLVDDLTAAQIGTRSGPRFPNAPERETSREPCRAPKRGAASRDVGDSMSCVDGPRLRVSAWCAGEVTCGRPAAWRIPRLAGRAPRRPCAGSRWPH